MTTMLKVGLTGGIGSGKSTVAKVFRRLGVPVYDSDSRAKQLMLDEPLRGRIISLFGEEAYKEGRLDTAFVAGRVFTDRTLLEQLNGLVHPAVMEDFREWAEIKRRYGYTYAIQENAIMFDHGFDRDMDLTITVSAPEEERAARAAGRDGKDIGDVKNRIANQITDAEREARADYVIRNGEDELIVPRIVWLHEKLTNHIL